MKNIGEIIIGMLMLVFISLISLMIYIVNNDKPQYDYQLNINNKTGILYSEDKIIGSFKLSGEIDSLIISDNQ